MRSGSKCLDLGRQSALVTGRLVLVYDFLVGNTVDHRNGCLIDTLSSRLVADGNIARLVKAGESLEQYFLRILT